MSGRMGFLLPSVVADLIIASKAVPMSKSRNPFIQLSAMTIAAGSPSIVYVSRPKSSQRGSHPLSRYIPTSERSISVCFSG